MELKSRRFTSKEPHVAREPQVADPCPSVYPPCLNIKPARALRGNRVVRTAPKRIRLGQAYLILCIEFSPHRTNRVARTELGPGLI